MNKLILSDNNIEFSFDKNIVLDQVKEFIPKLKLKITNNTELEININNLIETKIELQIEIDDNVTLKIIDIKLGEKTKTLTKYFVGKNCKVTVYKFNDISSIQQRDVVNLNKEDSVFQYILKTVSKKEEKYDIVINHNACNTESNIYTHGVNVSGNIVFNITTYIPKSITGCIANQNSRIINLVDKECVIRPNLLIDEFDVTANHSAFVGNFLQEEIFYIQRLGINYENAIKLLMQGFLKSKTDLEIVTNIFEKYWR